MTLQTVAEQPQLESSLAQVASQAQAAQVGKWRKRGRSLGEPEQMGSSLNTVRLATSNSQLAILPGPWS